MQYKAFALVAALAAGVSAQQPVPEDVSASVVNVLLTALPASALSLAVTNAPAFQSEMYSSLSAGNTPEWYKGLPDDVKTILPQMYPPETPAETTAAGTTTGAPTTAVATGTGAISGKPTGGSNSTNTVKPPTLSSTGGNNSPPAQTGAAGVIAPGLAGVFGIIGLLAL